MEVLAECFLAIEVVVYFIGSNVSLFDPLHVSRPLRSETVGWLGEVYRETQAFSLPGLGSIFRLSLGQEEASVGHGAFFPTRFSHPPVLIVLLH